ncbi:hypothetical protein [Periweissella ghanensis]|uniref:Uncharacterized protein n=1 Tax=Periweissella ghanensis TaxID=467997 RepID=A0ABM8ZD65_9LACO|nr:hypothetical protein [Periweissella ghanensis]MCM0601841.1 hypothetical protein [Periweissella ghanensis]CAH0418828.1 hypothetical protein WGH24286_01270 [Periweissella ghanensis]
MTNAQAALKNGQKPANAKYANATNSQVKAVVSAQLGHLVRQYMNDYKTGASKAALANDLHNISNEMHNGQFKLTYVGHSNYDSQTIELRPAYGSSGALFELSQNQVLNFQQILAAAVNAIRDAAGISTNTGHVQLNAQLQQIANTLVSPKFQATSDITDYLNNFIDSTGATPKSIIQTIYNDKPDYGIDNPNRGLGPISIKEMKQALLSEMLGVVMNPFTPDSTPGDTVLNPADDGVFKRILGISDYQMDATKS